MGIKGKGVRISPYSLFAANRIGANRNMSESGNIVLLKFPPGIPHKQKKQREDLQSSGKHIKDQDDLGRVGEQSKVGRGAYQL